MTETIFESSIASGGTANITHNFNRSSAHEMSYAYYLSGDSNATDMTVSWNVKPPGGSQFHASQETDESNVDLTSGQQFRPDLQGAGQHELVVTNNGASASTLTVKVVGYK